MQPEVNLGYVLGELILLPFRLLGGIFWLLHRLFRIWQSWRAVPLQAKSLIRVQAAIFVLVMLIGVSIFGGVAYDKPFKTWGALGIAAYAVLNLAVGLIGVLFPHRCRWDPMSVIWWSVSALFCAALLVCLTAPFDTRFSGLQPFDSSKVDAVLMSLLRTLGW